MSSNGNFAYPIQNIGKAIQKMAQAHSPSEQEWVGNMKASLLKGAVDTLAKSNISLEEIFEKIRIARAEFQTQQILDK